MTGLAIRYFSNGYFLCDGKAPEGCENDGELYIGNAVKWFETWDEANAMRKMINAAYGIYDKGSKEAMEEFIYPTELIGKIVKNDGYSLSTLLHDSKIGPATHKGDFVFTAEANNGKSVEIYTLPTNDDGDEIEIRSIFMEGRKI